MWNTKSDTFGWNLDRDTSILNYLCNFCKENNKCAMSSLLHCDYRKDDKCTQYGCIKQKMEAILCDLHGQIKKIKNYIEKWNHNNADSRKIQSDSEIY